MFALEENVNKKNNLFSLKNPKHLDEGARVGQWPIKKKQIKTLIERRHH
jgi:hypothetical protein